MARILLAWELGGGFGHAGPLRALADRLAERGHEPVFALRDVVTPAPLFQDRRYPVLQGPYWPKPFALRGRRHAINSHADMLATCGYGQADELAAMVGAWDDLLSIVKPDLVVVDNAPTLALALYDRIPAIFTGYGFTLPPAHERSFPVLRDETPPLIAELILLGNVEAVQKRRRARAPGSLTELFRGRFRAMTSVKELDPYRVRQDPELGPLERMPEPSMPPYQNALFAYLGGDYVGLDSLVQALSLLKMPVHAFLRDDAAVHAPFLASRGARIFREAPPLAEIVPQVSWVLSTGGHTTTHAALMGGRAQILLPIHLETRMTTDRLTDLGVGKLLERRREPYETAAAIAEIMADPAMPAAASKIAENIARRQLRPALDRLTDACLEAVA
jgi:rhamnosyltransferase subunit B